MAGVRRRLRDVGSRVSGVLGALRDEVVPEVLGGRPADAPGAEPEVEPEAEAQDAGAVPDVEPEAEAPRSVDAAASPDAEPDAAAAAPHAAAPAEPAAAATTPPGAPVSDTGDVTSTATAPAPVLDEVCAAAVELARAVAMEEGGATVGEHLGVEAEDAHTVTHSFATTDPAYVGWRWAVTVARAEGTDRVTVDEVVLLPGAGALLAPAWVPYAERVQPDDLGAGDLLPPAPDDPRLVPSYADTDDVDEPLFWELGLGRPRVLSAEGRLDAAERWYEGDAGPSSPRAQAAPGRCGGCGFLVPLGGGLRRAFGVCANGQAPDDGRVVALTHGCGAHSETPVELTHVPVAELVVDEVEYEFEEALAASDDTASDDTASASGGAGTGAPPDPLPDPADEQQAEELGHS